MRKSSRRDAFICSGLNYTACGWIRSSKRSCQLEYLNTYTKWCAVHPTNNTNEPNCTCLWKCKQANSNHGRECLFIRVICLNCEHLYKVEKLMFKLTQTGFFFFFYRNTFNKSLDPERYYDNCFHSQCRSISVFVYVTEPCFTVRWSC